MVSAMGGIRCILGVAPRGYGWHDTIDLQTAHEYAAMLWWAYMTWVCAGGHSSICCIGM